MPMKLELGKTALRINMSFAAAVTLTLILDESGMCAVALFCCLVHEAGHIICLLFLGEKPALIEFSFYGIKLERVNGADMSKAREISVYSSGPAANFILAALFLSLGLFSESMKTAGLISFFVGVFNLIPCRPLDGGNILLLLMLRVTNEEKAERICFFVSCAVLAPMAAASFTVLLRSGNFTLFTVTAYLAASMFFDKKEKDNIKM